MANIGVDIDEVLVPFVPTLAVFHNRVYGTNLKSADFRSYRFEEAWGGTKDESHRKIAEFSGHELARGMKIFPEAKETLLRLKDKHTFYAVTSRFKEAHDFTRQWAATELPGVFKDIRFCTYHAHQGPRLTKSQVCKELGIGLHIDDNINYARECSDAGIDVILFDMNGLYGWSKGAVPERATKVHSWREVRSILESKLKK